MKLRISGIVIHPGEGEEVLTSKIALILDISTKSISSLTVVRKSVDARRRKPPRFIYVVDISLHDDVYPTVQTCKGIRIEAIPEEKRPPCPVVITKPQKRPVIVGSGPAGLFAALILVERGVSPLLLERGRAIPERIADVRTFWEKGVLNPESHVYFGEGGAGTFSDGKLTSRAKNPYTAWVKETFVDMGAPSEILTDAKPHIGTDRLRDVVINLRRTLAERGCEIRFQSRASDFLVSHGRVEGVVVNGNEEIRTNHLIMAPGQSADDTYKKLHDRGVCLVPKPFAIGLRVEHPQALINAIQYGRWHDHPELPAAEYFLTAKLTGLKRSVYTFCMCPGGSVIGCSPEKGVVVINGMSNYRRDGAYANSAVVVNVHPDDFEGAQGHPLGGLIFRRRWEEKAFILGGGNYHAPAQRLVDFMKDQKSALPGATTFSPGVKIASMHETLPGFVVDALLQGFLQFEGQMRGFITAEATLIGVETRTSSPVRILRNPDGQSVNVSGLYPCGEGAGYAGGIVSSALDGIRIAESLAT
ncbi:MAG: NAD(P)/FAD-dependent oxidoreductase [Deltaproteobacteria bacterium]